MRWLPIVFIACASPGESDGEAIVSSDIESIRIDPSEVTIETGSETATTVQFTAWATTKEGEEVETGMVSWAISNLSAGSIDEDGMFSTSTLNGGVTNVTATHVGIEGSATITIVYKQDLITGDLPAGIADAFDAATPTVGDEPALDYPHDGVTVPRNLNGLAFAWDTPGTTNVSRIRLQSGITDMRVYTSDELWYSDSDLWATISASNTGGEVDVVVESGMWDGSTLEGVVQGPPFKLTVNRLDARGSVLYWVARTEGGVAAGDIMRIPFGSTEAEAFWSYEDAGNECVGCHTLVESENRMIVTHAGVNGNFSVIDVSDPDAPEVVMGVTEERRATFHAASPDGRHLLTVANGQAKLYSLSTGDVLQTLDTEGYQVSHPDWSPDGDDVVLVRIHETYMSDMNFEGGEIIQMSFDGNSFGPAEVLVPHSTEYNNYYPAYAPDGNWIAFNRAVRTEFHNPDGSVDESSRSYANPSAELWLVGREGDHITKLENANSVGEMQNSFPRWAPLPDDDVLWLAFSTTREYEVDPSERRLPQIWVSAIEPEKAADGLDPSSVAFWLPAQDSQSDNHLAIWWSK